jgi:hypothetical protein
VELADSFVFNVGEASLELTQAPEGGSRFLSTPALAIAASSGLAPVCACGSAQAMTAVTMANACKEVVRGDTFVFM